MLTAALPLFTAALLMIIIAVAVGVCGWVGGIDRIWFIAGVGAAMVALFSVQAILPHPTAAASRSFPYWFLGAFVVALALNVIAVFVGRAVKRQQDSSSPPQR
jgi:hypothetical protein